MKFLALLLSLMLLGCTDRPDAPAPKPPPYAGVQCKGELQEVTRSKIVMKCDDGKIVEYTTYKYSFTRKDVTQ